MEIAIIDKHGYPTEETLQAIENWDTIKDVQGFFNFIMPIFEDYGRFTLRESNDSERREIEGIYEVATGGWSGCEDAIGAMRLNYVFWGIHWRLSKRGGYYEFDKPKVKKEA